MDIRITSTGKIFYQVEPTLAALLLELLPAAVERVVPRPAPTPAQPEFTWSVGRNPLSGDYQVTFDKGVAGREAFFGPPSLLVSNFQKQGFVVPNHIVEQYTALWVPRETDHPAWVAEYNKIQEGKRK